MDLRSILKNDVLRIKASCDYEMLFLCEDGFARDTNHNETRLRVEFIHNYYEDEDSIITSVAYLVGFCTENDYVFEESWFHLVFAMLVCFDVYVLQLEALFNDLLLSSIYPNPYSFVSNN